MNPLLIEFNKPAFDINTFQNCLKFVENPQLIKNKLYSVQCVEYLQKIFPYANVFLTKSCTQALELAAFLLEIQPGDEVILPSFSYVSTATSFVNRGAVCKFVDINPDTLNIDPAGVEAAITPKTRALLVVNYGGIGAEYDDLLPICKKHGLHLVEDSAMGLLATYKNKPLGSFGHFSTISFDYLKNISCGEGGAFVLNDPSFYDKLCLLFDNGTNKQDFISGKSSFYEWQYYGTNCYLSEILASILISQFDRAQQITQDRLHRWNHYQTSFQSLEQSGKINLLHIPDYCVHNGHNYLIFLRDKEERTHMIKFLRERGIESAFHYVPLHSSTFGKKVGEFVGTDRFTTHKSNTLLRLPLYADLSHSDQNRVIESVFDFFKS